MGASPNSPRVRNKVRVKTSDRVRNSGWLGGWVVAFDSWPRDCKFNFQLFQCQVTILGKLFTHMCLCSPSSIIWYSSGQRAVMLCSWEGNCRSDVTLAMRHKVSGLSTYGLNSQNQEMSTSPTLQMRHGPLYLILGTRIASLAMAASGYDKAKPDQSLITATSD